LKTWERQLRLITGLVLAAYVIPHFLNHALGIASFDGLEAMRGWLSPIWSSPVPLGLLYFSLIAHFLLALWRLYQRRTLKMPAWEAVQLLFGLAIVPLLAGHVIGTRGASQIGGMQPDYLFVLSAIALSPRYQIQMPVLLVIVWMHVVFGLHFWLRLKQAYRRTLPLWIILAVAIPVLALSGITSSLIQVFEFIGDADFRREAFAEWSDMSEAARAFIPTLEIWFVGVSIGSIGVVLLARLLRRYIVAKKSKVRIEHSSGRIIQAQRGQTLLEAVRMADIPHASVCGGRARCTTCRVRVGVGKENLPAASSLEQSALDRIGAAANIRLACQLRPHNHVAITPLVNPTHTTAKELNASSLQGTEQDVVCMFVDMRGSTQMGEQILPYDVVYILNQFFNELSVALLETGGHYAQFAGDGLMALYGLHEDGITRGAQQSLRGASEMFRRLELLNQRLAPEFGIAIRMGVGIHSGAAIVGRMGPPQSPLLTAIGDNINIAARLESMTKTEGCDLIISESTLLAAKVSTSGDTISRVNVRGREDGILVAKMHETKVHETAKSTTAKAVSSQ
jgi:adenylate cyclase